MRKHRVSHSDLNGALRKARIWSLRQVEAVIIEPTGDFSIFKTDDLPDGVSPDVLMDVPGYKKLYESAAWKKSSGDSGGAELGGREANEIANEAA